MDMAVIRVKPPVGRCSPSVHRLPLNFALPRTLPSRQRCVIPACLKSSTAGASTFHSNRVLPPPVVTLSPLYSLKPYLQSQWQPILYGWLCGAISVYSLSQIVPKVGKLSTTIASLDALTLRNQALSLGILVLVRIIASYLQQAFTWDAALNCVYNVRVFVYHKVLQRELGFFEGENGVSAGDIAFRLTAEASDVADTVYSVLNVSFCEVLETVLIELFGLHQS